MTLLVAPRRMSDRSRSRGLVGKTLVTVVEQVVLTAPHVTVRV